jgi:hypothetical protein
MNHPPVSAPTDSRLRLALRLVLLPSPTAVNVGRLISSRGFYAYLGLFGCRRNHVMSVCHAVMISGKTCLWVVLYHGFAVCMIVGHASFAIW